MTRSEAAAYLRSHDNYLILTHRRPDGDTIGSAAGLCRGLRALGKTAHVLDNPQFTPRFAPWLEGLVCQIVPETATVVAVDTASEGLLAFGMEELLPRIALTIDHHGRSSLPVENRLIEAHRAACGEIIFGLLQQLEVPVDKLTAEALYVAVSTDTGCFKYSNVTADTLRIAAELIERGADTAPINKTFFDTQSFARLRLQARMTEQLELYAGGLVAISVLPRAWVEEFAVTEDDLDSISGFARSIEGVEIGVTIREVEGGKGKLSLRTSPRFSASALCGKLGGGGHAAAAGATVDGGLEAAKEAILNVLRESGLEL